MICLKMRHKTKKDDENINGLKWLYNERSSHNNVIKDYLPTLLFTNYLKFVMWYTGENSKTKKWHL